MHEHLREIMSASSVPVKPNARTRTEIKHNTTWGAKISQGKRVFDFAKACIGEEAMSHTMQSGQKPRLPKGFWPACCEQCFFRAYTEGLRKPLTKSFNMYTTSLRKGATTCCGMLGDKKAGQKISTGGSLNRTKCPEIGQLLYDWFIDCLQICSRVTQPLLIIQARRIKQQLINARYDPQAMPNLEGQAGKSWIRRWMRKFDIVRRRTVKHLKVSWVKLKKRVAADNVASARRRRCDGSPGTRRLPGSTIQP